MKIVGSFEAKTHLPEILKQVESGETVIVTRHGRPIAKISPLTKAPGSAGEVLRKMRELRLNIEADAIREMRDEGRR